MDQEVVTQIFRFLVNDIKLEEFEQWCYSSVSLEHILGSDDYLALVMVNFKAGGAKYEISRILDKHISEAEFETWKLKKLLEKIMNRTPGVEEDILETYDLYCRGYGFLRYVALKFGLPLDSLTQEEKLTTVEKYYPEIIEVAKTYRNWIEEGKIIPLGRGDDGYYDYKDLSRDAPRPWDFAD